MLSKNGILWYAVWLLVYTIANSIFLKISAQTYRWDEGFGTRGKVIVENSTEKKWHGYSLKADAFSLYIAVTGSSPFTSLPEVIRIYKIDFNGDRNFYFGNNGYVEIPVKSLDKGLWPFVLSDELLYVYGYGDTALNIFTISKDEGAILDTIMVNTPLTVKEIGSILTDDERIFLCGTWYDSHEARSELFLHCLRNSDYEPDSTWGENAPSWFVYGRPQTQLHINDIQFHGGGIVVYGFGRDPQLRLGVFFRLDTEGYIDRSFGTFMNVTTVENYGVVSESRIHVDDRKRIYLTDPTLPTYVLRYDSGGKVDMSYGNNGVASLPEFSYPKFIAMNSGISESGEICVFGSYRGDDDIKYPLLVSYDSTGKANKAFGPEGFVLMDNMEYSGFSDGLYRDMKWYVLGNLSNANGDNRATEVFLTRFVRRSSLAGHQSEHKNNIVYYKGIISCQGKNQTYENLIISDFNGHILIKRNRGFFPVRIGSLPSGLYVLKAVTSQGRIARKFVVTQSN